MGFRAPFVRVVLAKCGAPGRTAAGRKRRRTRRRSGEEEEKEKEQEEEEEEEQGQEEELMAEVGWDVNSQN